MTNAKLEIRIWTSGRRKLPDDLPEAFEPHAEHVSKMLAQGYTSGEIVDEWFGGWWTIIEGEAEDRS